MKKPGCNFLTFLFIFTHAQSLFAAGSGTTGAIILKHDFNPRAEAMAEAYVAVADDAHAMYWNPSGLAYMLCDEVSTTFSKGIVDDMFGQVSYVHTYNRELTFGAGLLTYSAGSFELVDEFGNISKLNAQVDFLLALSGAYMIDEEFTAGAAIELLHSTLVETVSGMTAAVTLGGSYKPDFMPPLRIGAAVKHLGLPLSYEGEGDPLPLTGQLGASYRLLESRPAKPEHDLIVAADASMGLDTPVYVNLGAEYWFQKMLAARIGYKINRDLEWLAFGFGIKYPVMKDMPMQLDYSLSLAAEFSPTHKLALSLFLAKNPVRISDEEQEAKKRAAEEAQKRKQAAKKRAEEKKKKQEEMEKKLPPVTIQVLEQEKKGGEVKALILNAGYNTKGVRRGVIGVIYNPGHALAGKCKLVEVYPTRTRAIVTEISADIGAKAVVELLR